MPSPFPGMDPYLESPTVWPCGLEGEARRIRAEPDPPLDAEDAAWADALLREKGPR